MRVLAATDYPLLNAFWTMLVFFGFILWFWLLFSILGDLYSRHDVSGWGKAGWTVFMIVLPIIGVLAYLISQGQSMGERRMKDAQKSQAEFDTYVKSVAASTSSADEIARAKDLLDSGAISQDEYDALKRKALAG
jgi:uncharacterized membrane protein